MILTLKQKLILLSKIDFNNYYLKTEIDPLCSNTDLSNYYTKSEADDIDNELSTLIINIYTKHTN